MPPWQPFYQFLVWNWAKPTVSNLETNHATGLATRNHSLTSFTVLYKISADWFSWQNPKWKSGKILVTIFVSFKKKNIECLRRLGLKLSLFSSWFVHQIFLRMQLGKQKHYLRFRDNTGNGRVCKTVFCRKVSHFGQALHPAVSV